MWLFYDDWISSGPISDIVGSEVKQWGERIVVSQWRQNDRWKIPSSFKRKFPTLALEIENTSLLQQQELSLARLKALAKFAFEMRLTQV